MNADICKVICDIANESRASYGDYAGVHDLCFDKARIASAMHRYPGAIIVPCKLNDDSQSFIYVVPSDITVFTIIWKIAAPEDKQGVSLLKYLKSRNKDYKYLYKAIKDLFTDIFDRLS